MNRKIKTVLWWMGITVIVLLNLMSVYGAVLATLIAIPIEIIYFLVRNEHPRFSRWLRILVWGLFLFNAACGLLIIFLGMMGVEA